MPTYRDFEAPPPVLYEDNHLIAVFKPAGLLTQGDAGGEPNLLDNVKEWIRRRDAKPGNVFLGLLHRLDKPVSGVVLFAKTSKGASRLSEQFRGREVAKTYRALVEGTPTPPVGKLVHYLGGDGRQGVTVFAEPGPQRKRAELDYRALGPGAQGGSTLVEVTLGTGRKHQIRAQLAHVGYPILGDKKYGASRPFSGGVALEAFSLAFRHPVRVEETITVRIPDELSRLRGGAP